MLAKNTKKISLEFNAVTGELCNVNLEMPEDSYKKDRTYLLKRGFKIIKEE